MNRVSDGWLAEAVHCPSPNFDARPAGVAVSLIVVHAISLPPEEFGGPGVAQLFTNTLDSAAHPYYATICDLRVSAHFFIRRDGALIQFVSADARAWHGAGAGASAATIFPSASSSKAVTRDPSRRRSIGGSPS
jgi:AmpD protein